MPAPQGALRREEGRGAPPRIRSLVSRLHETRVQTSAPPLVSFVVHGKLINLSGPQFLNSWSVMQGCLKRLKNITQDNACAKYTLLIPSAGEHKLLVLILSDLSTFPF